MVGQSEAKLERAARRYLDLLKGALLDEHYLENEMRLKYLARCIRHQLPLEPDRLRDPVRAQPDAYDRMRRRRRAGISVPADEVNGFLPYATMGRTRLDHLERCLDTIRDEGVSGALVDCATGRGGGAVFLRGYLEAYEIEERLVYVADEFRASPAPSRTAAAVDSTMADLQGDLNLVRDVFERFDLLDDRVRFLIGDLETETAFADLGDIALLRLGADIGADAGPVLEALYPHLSEGAFVVVDGYTDPAGAKAVTDFRVEHGIDERLEPVDWSAVAWRTRAAVASDEARVPTAPAAPSRLPLAPPEPDDAIDLTVVVVFYNMRREAARTLRSLSRGYQIDLEDVRYEVIAVENGSDPEQRLGADFVEGFGPEFRYIDLAEDARPSPSHALNVGIEAGRGRNYALMIDGAHVLTPSVLRFGLDGLKAYAPAIVATQQWYVGPGQQGEAMAHGYDQEYEDRLFSRIRWPDEGYRLFEIGHFVGGRDWLDGVWESNCMFVPRAQLEQVGGFEERFDMAGGGYANLELYERLGSAPDVTVATIIGEASFHQVHGGVSTNQPDPDERRSRVYGYGEHFADLRGRRFRGPGKPLHFVGRMASPDARRSRARRLSAAAFGSGPFAPEGDGLPTSPVPVPEDLRMGFIDAVWQSMAWNEETWLGHPVTSAPTDLFAYQRLITTVKPDWIIETGTGSGGRSLFLASVCELIGHGTVISIAEGQSTDLPAHPRLVYIDGVPSAPETVRQAMTEMGPDPRALLIVGGCASRDVTRAEFDAYARFVPPGSYAVVTDTMVNGNPVWPGFGQGPFEAVRMILGAHGEFALDQGPERYSLTFNPGGFLKRIR